MAGTGGRLAVCGSAYGRVVAPEQVDAITTHLRIHRHPGGARIAFGLESDVDVTLVVYDVAGRVVRELERSRVSRGVHEQTWDWQDAHGARVAAGVFFVRLHAGSKVISEKIVVIH
jgi:hypothetical protein